MLIPQKGEIRKPSRSASGIVPVAVMLPPRKCKHGTCLYCPSLNVPQSYTPKSPVVLRASQVNYDACEQVRSRIKAFKAMNHPTDKVELIIMGGTFLEYPKNFQYDFVKGCYDGLNEGVSSKDTQGGHTRRAREPLRGKNLQAGDSSKDDSGEPSPRDDSSKDDSGEPSGEPSVNLEKAKKLNEKAKHRCVALCIETRPDVCIKYIDRLIEFGCTRVELGVQILSDKIYKEIKRGHVVQDVVEATKTLRNAGFKIGYHVMPGLPGSNAKKDLDSFKKLFSDERFKPDQLKIYPCQVMPGSELEKWYWQGKYKPYTKEETEKILVKMLKIIPRYCRVMRIMREIPPEYLVAGTTRIDLRKEIEEKLRKRDTQGCTPWRRENPKEGREPFQGLFEAPKNLFKIFTRGIKEIRFREVGFADKENLNPDLRLKITKYKSSGGQEYFLEIVNKDDILFGLLRLRISRNSAIIRELHVYGKALSLGERKSVASQHTGLGKQLMKRAEEITRDNGLDILRVISGVGVREYYRKLGYKLKEGYMVKNLKIF